MPKTLYFRSSTSSLLISFLYLSSKRTILLSTLSCSITRVTQEDCLVTHILQPDAESHKSNGVCPSVLSYFIKKHKSTCACTHRHALWVFVKCIYS